MTEAATGSFVRRNPFLIVLGLVIVIGLIVAFSQNGNDDKAPSSSPTSAATDQSTDDGSASSPKFDGHGADVDRSMFGEAWPLTVSSGRINCIGASGGPIQVVFTSDDNKRYAVNGTARGAAADFGYLDVESIWADDPNNPGAKIDISPLIDICAPLM